MVGYKMFDYESPIEAIVGQIQTQFEDDCVKAVQSYGFNINKEELKKALLYDRGQYEKGYAAAKEEFKRPEGEWIPYKWDCEKKQPILLPKGSVTEYVRNAWSSKVFICSVCGKGANEAKFCPNCGADMRGDE